MSVSIIVVARDRNKPAGFEEELANFTPMSDAEFADAVKRYVKCATRVKHAYAEPSIRIEFKPKVALQRTRCNPVCIEVSHRYNEKGQMLFSVSAEICSKTGKYSERAGQIEDAVYQLVDYAKWPVKARRLIMEILDLWVKHHNNELHAGTPEQEKLLKDANLMYANDYEKAVAFLKERDMYEVALADGTMYKYGTAWLTADIPHQDQRRILRLCRIQEYLPES